MSNWLCIEPSSDSIFCPRSSSSASFWSKDDCRNWSCSIDCSNCIIWACHALWSTLMSARLCSKWQVYSLCLSFRVSCLVSISDLLASISSSLYEYSCFIWVSWASFALSCSASSTTTFFILMNCSFLALTYSFSLCRAARSCLSFSLITVLYTFSFLLTILALRFRSVSTSYSLSYFWLTRWLYFVSYSLKRSWVSPVDCNFYIFVASISYCLFNEAIVWSCSGVMAALFDSNAVMSPFI